MEAILHRQQQLEETNRHLCEKAGELRRSLRDLDISQDRYRELRDLPEEELSIQEYVAVSMVSENIKITKSSMKPLGCDTVTLRCVFRCVSTRW